MDLYAELLGRRGPQAVSMTAQAITQRLQEWAELTRLCLLLGESGHSGTGTSSSRTGSGPEGPNRAERDRYS
jgi:hypothetical protein